MTTHELSLSYLWLKQGRAYSSFLQPTKQNQKAQRYNKATPLSSGQQLCKDCWASKGFELPTLARVTLWLASRLRGDCWNKKILPSTMFLRHLIFFWPQKTFCTNLYTIPHLSTQQFLSNFPLFDAISMKIFSITLINMWNTWGYFLSVLFPVTLRP